MVKLSSGAKETLISKESACQVAAMSLVTFLALQGKQNAVFKID